MIQQLHDLGMDAVEEQAQNVRSSLFLFTLFANEIQQHSVVLPSMPDTFLFDRYSQVASTDLIALMSADRAEVEREFEAITGEDSDSDGVADDMIVDA